MPQGLRILVVDNVTDTEEVLRAVLEPRGMLVNRRTRHHPASHVQARPTVVVLDEEATTPQTELEFCNVPQVIIGRTELPAAVDRRVLAKPFHYAELVQAIEQLVAHRRAI